MRKTEFFLALLSLAPAVVQAGPPVTVTFKNLHATTAAANTVSGSNQSVTYANATPKPAASVAAQTSNTYTVTSTAGPTASFAEVRYTIGAKYCVFTTTFTNLTSSGGSLNWAKTASPGGGATCAATITSTNPTTYAWTVEFTMK